MEVFINFYILSILKKTKYDTIKDNSFDDMCGFMMNKNNLKKYKLLLKLLGIGNIHIKKFMSIFMLHYFPKETMTLQDGFLSKKLENYSCNIIKYLNKFLLNNCFVGLYKFLLIENIKLYINTYDVWIKADKLFLIKELYQKYFKQEKFINETKNIKPAIKENAIYMRDKILGKIQLLTPEGFKLNFELNEIYLKVFAYELENDNYDKLLETLEHIKNLLKPMVPNRPDIHKEIDERIDIEWLKGIFNNEAFDDLFILNLFTFLFSMLERFQAQADDAETEQWKTETLKILYENKPLYSFIPGFLEKYIDKLKQIYTSINNLKDFLGNNK